MIPILTSSGVWAGAAALVSAIFTASGHGPAAVFVSDPHNFEAFNVLWTSFWGMLAAFGQPPKFK